MLPAAGTVYLARRWSLIRLSLREIADPTNQGSAPAGAIFGIFKDDQLFDGAKVFVLAPASAPPLAALEVACA